MTVELGYASVSRTSAPVTVAPGVLSETPAPTITGVVETGQVLTAEVGLWGPDPVELTFRWLRDGEAIEGATTETYALTADDAGARIAFEVTGSKDGYTTVAMTSAETEEVERAALGQLTATPVPKISGTVKVGKKLTARPGAWGPDEVALSYQWYRSGKKIAKATTSTYTLVAADMGKTMKVKVTGVKDGYAAVTKTSKATKKVAAGTLTTVKPKISGSLKVGTKLTAKPGVWKPSGVKLSYQWLRSGKAIKGATKAVYKLTSKDKGKKITVKVTGKKSGYTTKSATSKATKKVG